MFKDVDCYIFNDFYFMIMVLLVLVIIEMLDVFNR